MGAEDCSFLPGGAIKNAMSSLIAEMRCSQVSLSVREHVVLSQLNLTGSHDIFKGIVNPKISILQ